jgi:hypothetical protein
MAPKAPFFIGWILPADSISPGKDLHPLRPLSRIRRSLSDQQIALISSGQAEQRPRHAGILQRRLTGGIKMTNNTPC